MSGKLRRKGHILMVVFILSCLLLAGCTEKSGTPTAEKERETLYQISTITSLIAGNYDGVDSLDTLKKNGDIGIGTFSGLDGELIMLDGNIYQVKASGEVKRPQGKVTTPFSAVTFFDKDVTKQLSEIDSYEKLIEEIDSLIPREDAFYAIRIDGKFRHVKVRSVPRQQKPYQPLSEITQNQPEFEYDNIKGSLVGFWCPEYVGGVNVPGYHLHFISEDRTKGGHLLEVNMINGTVALDLTRTFRLELAEENCNNAQGLDIKEEIEKVEK